MKILKETFRSLRFRNYRLFFFGQGVSLIGTWMQQVAVMYLVYRLTDSAFLLGLVGFAGQIPAFLFAPMAGVYADRYDRRRILLITQVLSMAQASLMALLFYSSFLEVGPIIVLCIGMGIVNAFDISTRQSFVINMVERKENLGNAISLNSAMFNLARLIGPAAAGMIISAGSEGVCFLLNAASYLAAIVSLGLMRMAPVAVKPAGSPVLTELKAGFVYIWNTLPLRAIILLMALISFFGMPYTVLMPIFSRDILHGGAHTFGFLMAASGCGALTGTLVLAGRKNTDNYGRIMAMATLFFGGSVIAFSLSRILWLSFIIIFMAGFGVLIQMAAGNTLLQTIVDDRRRGMVVSINLMAFIGMVPFGSLLAGLLSEHVGAPLTLAGGGFCCSVGGLFFWRFVLRQPLQSEINRKKHLTR